MRLAWSISSLMCRNWDWPCSTLQVLTNGELDSQASDGSPCWDWKGEHSVSSSVCFTLRDFWLRTADWLCGRALRVRSRQKRREEEQQCYNFSAVCQEHDILFERFLAAGTGAASVQLGLHLRHRHCKQQPSAPPCRCVTAVWCWVVRNSCSEVCMGKRAVCHTHGNKSWFWCFLGIVEQCHPTLFCNCVWSDYTVVLKVFFQPKTWRCFV